MEDHISSQQILNCLSRGRPPRTSCVASVLIIFSQITPIQCFDRHEQNAVATSQLHIALRTSILGYWCTAPNPLSKASNCWARGPGSKRLSASHIIHTCKLPKPCRGWQTMVLKCPDVLPSQSSEQLESTYTGTPGRHLRQWKRHGAYWGADWMDSTVLTENPSAFARC